MAWIPAVRGRSAVSSRKAPSIQDSMSSPPSIHKRAPSSTRTWKRYTLASKGRPRIQRAEKSLGGMAGAGEPSRQSKSRLPSSRTSAGAPARSPFGKYSPPPATGGGGGGVGG